MLKNSTHSSESFKVLPTFQQVGAPHAGDPHIWVLPGLGPGFCQPLCMSYEAVFKGRLMTQSGKSDISPRRIAKSVAK